jgi:hypothetical protein
MTIINMTYTVGFKPGVHLDEQPDPRPAGRKNPFFVPEIWLSEPNFRHKE